MSGYPAPAPPPPRPPGAPNPLRFVLIGCGAAAFVACLAAGVFFVWLSRTPEAGVKLANELDAYALDYLKAHGMLKEGEEVLAYYDATLSMDGTEAAILTDLRVMYHQDGRTTSMDLSEIEDIGHRKEGLVGDVIEIRSSSGKMMKIEIAPLNQGESFLVALQAAREARAKR